MSSKSPIQPGNSKTRQSSLPLGLPIGSLGSLPDLSKLMHETASPWYKFKLFVLQTKVLESGVGVVLGKAFQEFVRSFLNDLLAPPILYIFQNNATQRFLVIKQGRTPKRRYRTVEEAGFDGALTINYGKFGHSCVNFFVVGLSVYYFLNAGAYMLGDRFVGALWRSVEVLWNVGWDLEWSRLFGT
ncbi:hypothetical protein BC830DRAFT_1078982 [Chytriomyces sp. MP71]|nr:hypothetical protein BC830DRAFT_1078982 [Chytriomyces sp. MP71]